MSYEKAFANPRLLEKIDQLFACNVGEHIDLPQLVVVGDQSSGKSSVLEGLTDLPFPRASELCTRFATKITFRRVQDISTNVSIIPASDATLEHAENVKAYKKTIVALDTERFAEIMSEVQRIMGIRVDMSNNSKTSSTSAFSGDVLSLEICGPNEPHMSVIDVPGIFKRTTQGLTTKADIELVRKMVEGYMKNPRSVMLTVIPANVDIATQEILEMAEEVDKDGHRTLGVLTKPDLVDKGAERSIVDLIAGKRHQLTLGWNLVKNPSQKELDESGCSQSRHDLEKAFFTNESPWNKLEKDKVGIRALRDRLQEVLGDHIRREFPKVKAEISKKLKTCNDVLDGLGPARNAPSEQSKYVMNVAMKFWRLIDSALSAKYNDEFFMDHPEARLATHIVLRNERFAEMMYLLGHTFHFDGDSLEKIAKASDTDDKSGIASREGMLDLIKTSAAKGGNEIAAHELDMHEDLRELLVKPVAVQVPKSDNVMVWLGKVYNGSRGFEIGTYDTSLLAATMREQSAKWNNLAHGYINDIITMVHEFICVTLRHLCPDERLFQGLRSLLLDSLLAKYRVALEKIVFLLKVERAGTPTTLNHYFNSNLEKCRQRRIKAALAEKKVTTPTMAGDFVRFDDIATSHSMSNESFMIQDIHDTLQSYYKVARKRFVDNVCMQATDFDLLKGENTPLQLFSPGFVNVLTEDQLDEIAGEDIVIRRRRAMLKKQQHDLEAGRKILN